MTWSFFMGLFHLVGLAFGWPLRLFRRWLDQQPHREPSQISTLQKMGRPGSGHFLVSSGLGTSGLGHLGMTVSANVYLFPVDLP
jgi:hypothetical protein